MELEKDLKSEFDLSRKLAEAPAGHPTGDLPEDPTYIKSLTSQAEEDIK